MCFPGAQFIPIAAQGVMQSLGSLSTARYEATMARHEGKQARLAASVKAQQIEQKGAQELAAMRRAVGGTGNVSALDVIADQATSLAQELGLAKYGGSVAEAEAKARAHYAKQQGWQGVVNQAVHVGTQMLTGFSAGGGFINPPIDSLAYGQRDRYGPGSRLTGAGGRLVGGL
ncbi:MAG TPA: hypothetical protein VJL84_08855 [Kiloniellales bacterium]|nr:hypothetical protein [Kiloniellales bacterium]